MRVDVSRVFTPLLAVPCFLVFHPDEQGTPRAAQMFDHGQFRSSEQETVGHLHVPHEMGPQDPDPAAPRTHRITGDDLLWTHKGDAAVKIHPAFDFLKILLAEADIVPDEDIKIRPVFKVYGRCDECQKLLRECPTKKDVGLGPTEVMYVMMPPEWCEPVDWSECDEGCSERA